MPILITANASPGCFLEKKKTIFCPITILPSTYLEAHAKMTRANLLIDNGEPIAPRITRLKFAINDRDNPPRNGPNQTRACGDWRARGRGGRHNAERSERGKSRLGSRIDVCPLLSPDTSEGAEWVRVGLKILNFMI